MTDDLRYARQFPELCFREVSRKGELQPCERTAVAVCTADSGPPYPVCAFHALHRNGADLVPLTRLFAGPVGVQP